MQSPNQNMPIEAYLSYMNRTNQSTPVIRSNVTPCETKLIVPTDNTESCGNVSLTAQNDPVSSCSTLTPIEIPPEPRSSQNAQKRPLEPLDETKLWKPHEALLATLPEADQEAVKIGIISEYILQGIRAKKPIQTLFLLASLGMSIANRDRQFYEAVRDSLVDLQLTHS